MKCGAGRASGRAAGVGFGAKPPKKSSFVVGLCVEIGFDAPESQTFTS